MKFKRGKDPIKAMSLGYGKKPETKAWKILEFIDSKGEEGAGLTEIQYFIWTEIQGYDPDDFWQSSTDKWGYSQSYGNQPHNKLRNTRGYYNTALYGGGSMGEGLLHRFCKKNPATKKWVLQRMPGPGENIYEEQSYKLVPETLNEMLSKKYRYIK